MQAKAGKMKFIIGSGDNEIDWTYVGNVAQAHLDVSYQFHTIIGYEKMLTFRVLNKLD